MTAKRHAGNERAKRRYLQFLREAKGRDEPSIDADAKAIERYEAYNRYRDFRKFHIERVMGFKTSFADERNVRTGKPLSASTIASTLGMLKAFFLWLADQPEYRGRIRYADAEYFNPPDNLSRVASAQRYKPCPTLAQIRVVLEAMPAMTEVERRDRALIAFTVLTGARDRAIISFKLKHIDLERGLVMQDAREVRTKRAKSFTTWFFPVGRDILQIVVDWVSFLRREKGFDPESPVFPKTRVAPNGEGEFAADGLSCDHWANADPVHDIFKQAFHAIGIPYFNPHLIRDTLVELADERGLTIAQFKAWSQNLGHESMMTTITSYGTLAPHRQAEIIRELGEPEARELELGPELLRKLADQMERNGRSG